MTALAFLEVTDMKSHVRVKVTGYFVPWSSECSYSSAGMAMVAQRQPLFPMDDN